MMTTQGDTRAVEEFVEPCASIEKLNCSAQDNSGCALPLLIVGRSKTLRTGRSYAWECVAEVTPKDEEPQYMKLTVVKVVAMVAVPFLSGICVVAAAHYLMSGLEPPRVTAVPVGAATVCVSGDAPVYHIAHHGHRPPGSRRDGRISPRPATGTVKQAAVDQKVAK
jgi:hypothetical protein